MQDCSTTPIRAAVDWAQDALSRETPSMTWMGGTAFPAWQRRAREELARLLGLDRFRPVPAQPEIEFERPVPGGTEIRFTFQSEADWRVPCHLFLPDGAERPPVMICLQGHSTGMHISMGRPKYEGDEALIGGGDRDFCVRALKEGFAAVAVEQRGFGECGGDETGPKCYEAAMTALLSGRTLLGARVWDVLRLIDVLETEFAGRVDPARICCMGNSGGGTVTAYAAALDERIALAMPSCAMCAWGASIGAMRHCACNYVPGVARVFDMGDLMAMACPRYFIQVSGVKDHGFLIAGAEAVFAHGAAAYAAAGHADRCTLIRGAEGHRFYADDAWPAVHKYLG